jgi:hypothetical protein
MGMLSVGGLIAATFCLHDYLPRVSKDWSQKEMWDAYYSHCTRYTPEEEAKYREHMLLQTMRVPSRLDTFPRAWCKEPVVAFRTNWRGETFYSANTVIPAPETKHLKPFLTQWGNDKPFYLFTERNRVHRASSSPTCRPTSRASTTRSSGPTSSSSCCASRRRTAATERWRSPSTCPSVPWTSRPRPSERAPLPDYFLASASRPAREA